MYMKFQTSRISCSTFSSSYVLIIILLVRFLFLLVSHEYTYLRNNYLPNRMKTSSSSSSSSPMLPILDVHWQKKTSAIVIIIIKIRIITIIIIIVIIINFLFTSFLFPLHINFLFTTFLFIFKSFDDREQVSVMNSGLKVSFAKEIKLTH